jgi:hypothetical protein
MTPAPIGYRREMPVCPVCGKISYSVGGIHPQCAVSRADERLRVPGPAKKSTAGKPSGFSKRCRGCGRSVAARRMVCDCGRAFPSSTMPGGHQKSTSAS